jgi:hypothetical protein
MQDIQVLDLSLTIFEPEITVSEQEVVAKLSGDFHFSKLNISGTISLFTYFTLSGGAGSVELRPGISKIAFSKLAFNPDLPIPLPSEVVKSALNDLLRSLSNQIDSGLRPFQISIPDPEPAILNLADASKSVPGFRKCRGHRKDRPLQCLSRYQMRINMQFLSNITCQF